MQSIDAKDLRQKIDSGEDIFLVDVREPWEREFFNIGGISIPMNDITDHINKIPKDKPVVFYCEKGIRSGIVIQRLAERNGFENLINLSGGIQAWKKAGLTPT
ncbi:rhodanese-like domain-containing protein [Ferruginibacter sp. HRS2-29]|uniref:rhodanese-like domain-containing protein n=1 Tax=Ferruginibacter sp. HRS2-29 TaxID=2487334 RepID=UPI0020CF13AB|nr:rhodanese-like domain-containing protein [Ferruginibacter sp. HRS2-29]MCP9751785.1 rhodanese-like domain-containing protein [Ferruginibacter sp. HRS2-29]